MRTDPPVYVLPEDGLTGDGDLAVDVFPEESDVDETTRLVGEGKGKSKRWEQERCWSRRCRCLKRCGWVLFAFVFLAAFLYLFDLHVLDAIDPLPHCVAAITDRGKVRDAVAYSERHAAAPKHRHAGAVQRHRPMIVFDSSEAYYPVSVEAFIANSSLVHWDDLLVGFPHLTPPDVAAAAVTYRTDTFMHPSNMGYGVNPRQGSWGGDRGHARDVPVYGDARLICIATATSATDASLCDATYTPREARRHGLRTSPPRYYEIRYVFLYAYNGDMEIFFGAFHVGHHTGDVEHITVRVDAATDRILEVYYEAHSHCQGAWFPEAAIQSDYAVVANGSLAYLGSLNATVAAAGEAHPVVYAGRSTHASYSQCGTNARHGWGRYLLPHDHNDGRGDVWFPHTVVPIDGSVFGAWGGTWGMQPAGVTHQEWWAYEDPAGH